MGCSSSKVGEKASVPPLFRPKNVCQANPEIAGVDKAGIQGWLPSLDHMGSCQEPPELGPAWLQAMIDRECLDSWDDGRFDAITDLLKELLQAPVARVSLTAAGRQALYGSKGSDFRHPDGERHACCRASRRAHHPSMQLVPDTRADARFERCACVAGPPHVRFFAAAPLVSSEGHVLGNLGVMDTRPRSFPAGTLNIICSFAELAVRELERDRDVPPEPRSAVPALPLDAQQRAVRALSSSREAVLLLDLSRPTWPIQYVNERWCASTGLTEQDCLRTGLWQVLDVAQDQEALELAAGSLRARAPFALTIAGPAGRQLTLELRPATADHLSAAMPPVGIPNLMESSREAAESGADDGLNSLYFGVLCCEDGEALSPMLSRALSSMLSCALPSMRALEAWPPPPPPPCKRDGPAGRHCLTNLDSANGRGVEGGKGEAKGALGGGGCQLSAVHIGDASPQPSCTLTHHTRLSYGIARPVALRGLKLGPLLGSGAFGRVYRGTWRGASVAVKILSTWADPAQGTSATPAQLEALLSKRLSHPNIVQTLEFAVQTKDQDINPVHTEWLADDFGNTDEGGCCAPGSCFKQRQQTWIVQEFCDRGTLADAISRGWLRKRCSRSPQPDLHSVLATAHDVAAALRCCHEQGVLHGNLTAGNVQLAGKSEAAGWDERGFQAKVGDFGLARVLDPGQNKLLTRSCGTMAYMPLELIQDNLLTKAADVYSFGVLCWEMLNGQRAWAGRRPVQILHARTALKLQLKVGEGIRCPARFKELVTACLSDDHTRRPSFDEVVAELEALLPAGLQGA